MAKQQCTVLLKSLGVGRGGRAAKIRQDAIDGVGRRLTLS